MKNHFRLEGNPEEPGVGSFVVMARDKLLGLGVCVRQRDYTFYWVAATSGGFDWARHWRLAQTSSEVEAVVTRTEPNNHCLAHYEFEVDGQLYQGSDSKCSASIGDKLRVYYLPGEPTFSTLKKPDDDLVFMIVAPPRLVSCRRVCRHVADWSACAE